MRALLVILVVFLVNLPAAHEGWTDHRVASQGRQVEGQVLDARRINGRYLVDYRLPASVDPDRTEFAASVDEVTYRFAKTSEVIRVRAIPGEPGSNRPDGLVESSLFTVIALVGDLVLAVIGVLVWYRRRNPGDMPDPRPRPVGL